MTRTEQLVADALALPALERALLVERVLDSLDKADPEMDAAWSSECEARIDAYERGELRAVPLHEALARFRSP